MRFDDKYRTKLSLYKRGRCDGPSTYTYKKHGFRLHWLNYTHLCNFCEKLTSWGITYFYPNERFKEWKHRDVSTYYICCEEEIPLLKAQIVENKINESRELNFVPRSPHNIREFAKLGRK